MLAVVFEMPGKQKTRMSFLRRQQWCHGAIFIAMLSISPGLSAEIFVVASAASPPLTLQPGQVGDLFMGKLLSLPDGRPVQLVDQPESAPLRNEFYLEAANKSAAQARAQWAKLYFTGRGIPPRVAEGSKEVKKLVNSSPNALGYIDSSALDDSVRVVCVLHKNSNRNE